MNWDILKNNEDLLIKEVNKKSAKKVAEEHNLSNHKAVTHHLKKYGYKYNGKNWVKKAGEKEGLNERKPLKKDKGEYWVLKSGDRSFEITKEKYKRIRRDYSGENYLTINQICRKHKIPRWKLIILRNAFGFTHDDTPFTDEEMLENEPEELAEIELQQRKDQYFKKLKEKEVDNALKKLKKYQQKDYYIEKMDRVVREHFERFLKNYKPKKYKCKQEIAELMLELPIVDLHLAKLCWSPETGENFDREIAQKRFMGVVYDVMDRTKEKKLEKILFPIGNDYFNFDDIEGKTTKGTAQDIDTRWQKMFAIGVEMLIRAIDILMQKAPVEVFVVPGNHDKQTSYYAMMYISAYYRNEKAINVDTSPKTRKYKRFGKCLIGFSHMDKEKKRIYGNMQVEAKKDWGETDFHEWHGAHLHSDQVKEDFGVIVRNLSSITGRDSWHYEKGYMSMPKNQSFLWHKEKGLRNIIVTPILEGGI